MISLASCKRAEEITFNHPASVYFDIYNEAKDSIVYTFAYKPTLSRDTIWLPVRIVGTRLPVSRHFTARVEQDSSTAKPGIHYELLKDSYTVDENDGGTYLPFVIFNTDKALEEHSFSAIIKLTASDDFGIEVPNLVRAKVVFSSKLEKPDWWEQWMGSYSRTKHEFFIMITGRTSLTREGLDAPMNLYFAGLVTTMLNNPFKWVEKNALLGYKLDEVTVGSTDQYYFYNIKNPAKKTLLRKNKENNKYYFIDENGQEVI